MEINKFVPSGMKKILVTGSNGYIGSVLVNLLLKNNYLVTGIDTLFYKDEILGNYTIDHKLIKSDIRDVNSVDLSSFDAIIHLAALSNDTLGRLMPEITQQINFRATVNLAKKAKKKGVKRFIFSSSCSIYGAKNGEIVNEKSKITPVTAYAKSKLSAEKALIELADKNFCVGILRNSTVYGHSPKLRNDIVVNNLVASSIACHKINIFSDGTPWRALIDIRDLSHIFIEFLRAEARDINGQVLNIGFKENNFQVKDIVAEIRKQLPNSTAFYQKLHDKKYDLNYRVSFSKFKSIFSHIKQEWPLSSSIRDLIAVLKKEKFTQADFHSGKFIRIQTINSLLKRGLLDNNLHWKKLKHA